MGKEVIVLARLPRVGLPAFVAAVIVVTDLTACTTTRSSVRVESRPDRFAPGVLVEAATEASVRGLEPPPIIDRGIALTKVSEGWVPHLYHDSARFCTIGYGHLVKRSPCDGTEDQMFIAGLTETQGETLLINDLAGARATVTAEVTVELTNTQYAALCDFVFNVGRTNFRSSTLLQVINRSNREEIPGQFRRWILAGGKRQRGLEVRREREISLYFDGVGRERGDIVRERLPLIDIRRGESQPQ